MGSGPSKGAKKHGTSGSTGVVAAGSKAALARRRRVLLGEGADKEVRPFENLDPLSMFQSELEKYEDDEVFIRMKKSVIEDFRKRAHALIQPDGRLDHHSVCELLDMGLPRDSQISSRLFQMIRLHDDGSTNRNVTVYEVMALMSIIRAGEQLKYEDLHELCFCLFDFDGDDRVSAFDFCNTGYALLSLGVDGLVGQDLAEFKSLTEEDKQRETLNVAKRICMKYHMHSAESEQKQHDANVDKLSDDGKGGCCGPKKPKKTQAPMQNPTVPEPPKLTFEEWAIWFDDTVDLAEALGSKADTALLRQSTSELLRHVGTVLPSKMEISQIKEDLEDAQLDDPNTSLQSIIGSDLHAGAKTAEAKTAASVAVGEAPLPEGWASAKDPSTGRTYYYNKKTNETQWQHPASPLVPKPQPPVVQASTAKYSTSQAQPPVVQTSAAKAAPAAAAALHTSDGNLGDSLNDTGDNSKNIKIESFRASDLSESEDDFTGEDKRKGFAGGNPTLRLSQLNNAIEQQLSGISDTYGSASPA